MNIRVQDYSASRWSGGTVLFCTTLLFACLFAAGAASADDFDPGVRTTFEGAIVPEVVFSNTPMPEVLAFLVEVGREYDPRQDAAQRRSLSFISDLPPEEQAKKRVSLNARWMSVRSIVDFLCRAWDLHVQYGHNSVMLTQNTGPILKRVYDIEPHILTGGYPENSAENLNPDTRLEALCSRLGIPFPDGTGIAQVPCQSRIIVRNTQENLFAIDDVLTSINNPAYNTEISARLLEVTDPAAITDEHGYIRLYDEERGLNTNAVRVVAEISTIVRSGSLGSSRIKTLTSPSKKGGRRLIIEAFLEAKPLWFDYVRRVDLDLTCSFSIRAQPEETSDPMLHHEIHSRVTMHNGSENCFEFHGPPLLDMPSEGSGARRPWYILIGARIADPMCIAIPADAQELESILRTIGKEEEPEDPEP